MDLPSLSGSPDASGSDRASKYVNWNPFIFGGKVAGSIARVSDEPLITSAPGAGCCRRSAIAELF